jgi:metal-sulfur cluster biosynthetic enzyme
MIEPSMPDRDQTEQTAGSAAAAEPIGSHDVPDLQAEAPMEHPGTLPDIEQAVLESELREALRAVVDPEIGLDVVTLGLIRHVRTENGETEVGMILTTPFCPYAGAMIQQVKLVSEATVGGPVRVALLDEVWTPELMEGGDWAEWGLVY